MDIKYEFLDHTADVCLRAYGKTREDLFLNCALALSTLLVEESGGDLSHREITLKADTWEDLLIAWLNELIFRFFTFSFLFGAARLNLYEQGDKKQLSAEVQGIDFDPARTKMNLEVKAATYHDVKITRDEKEYRVTIVFDV